MKRMFEYSEGTSNKFWEVSLEKKSVITRYGKIGNAGKATPNEYVSAKEARDAFEKLIHEKTSKGYVEKLEVETIWERLKVQLKTLAPDLHKSLQKGASEKQILKLEKQLGVQLPQDYRRFLNLCNGLKPNSEVEFYDGELLSVSNVSREWRIWRDLLADGDFEGISSKPAKGIREDWWNLKWIPFTHDGGGNHMCLDLDPAKGGKLGQVITMWHDSEERELMHSSFTAWLRHILKGLETGKIVFDTEDYNALVNIEDLE